MTCVLVRSSGTFSVGGGSPSFDGGEVFDIFGLAICRQWYRFANSARLEENILKTED